MNRPVNIYVSAFLGVHRRNDRISSTMPVVLTNFRHFNNVYLAIVSTSTFSRPSAKKVRT